VVISTATKISFSEQLLGKDIPFLPKQFSRLKVKVAVIEGRGNFLCVRKLHRMADQGRC